MLKVTELLSELEKLAPLSISEAFISAGNYDNSGLIINCHEEVDSVLFSLDLSLESVKKAKKLKCDTIVTHHPAIYNPLSNLWENCPISAPVLEAIKNNINVISMHINLDMAKEGIDKCLSDGLGVKNQRVLIEFNGTFGYGREGDIEPQTLANFVKKVKAEFGTNKVICYGNSNAVIKSVASFCGAGSSEADGLVKGDKLASDLIVTSDMPHHVIKDLVEKGKNILILTHYAGEDYGFNRFFIEASRLIENKVNTHYFSDKRFK